MANLPISQDVYLELPTEPVLQSLGTNYNALVRTWTLRQYQLHLEHHQKMVHYYQQCIGRLEDLEIKYEREPEMTPVAAVSGAGPIKLSDLAKMKPHNPQPVRSPTTPAHATTATTAPSGPSANIKSFDGKGNTLSSSLAANEVKLDKKPKPIKVNVQLDQEEVAELTEPELEHFSRPQPKRKNNKRTDIPKLDDQPEEDEVSTWQETPNAFSDKKESKFKSTFGNLKQSLFKDKDDKDAKESKSPTTATSSISNTNNSSSTRDSSNAPPQPPSTPQNSSQFGGSPPVYNPSTSYASFNNPPSTPQGSGPAPPIPPMPASGPAMPTTGPPRMPSAPPPINTLHGSTGYKPPPPPPTP